ncbi:glycogen debranching N-terminal domain-containing protein [Plantactinospora sp. KBS50]|uniref:amylo-alpha-1,6-glucosidase n=1 Tax=Plantactinospora sp. KBS50 TaxID=2024580 RepID=UPI001E52BF63|nr:glycogen debranching N-terminal domain-containing protein [Plantactinospora sp. KBS50]
MNEDASHDYVSILDGNSFLLSDRRGDVCLTDEMPTGLFSFDTCFLSRWELTVNGESLQPLSVDDLQHFEARFFLVPGAATHYVDAKVSVIRHRWIGGSFDEEVTVLNHSEEPVGLTVRMEMASDFSDLVYWRADRFAQPQGTVQVCVQERSLRIVYERETFRRETVVSSTVPGRIDEHGMTFDIRIDPHGSWVTGLHVDTLVQGSRGRDIRASLDAYRNRPAPGMRAELDRWLAEAPKMTSNPSDPEHVYRRSLVDLAALRYSTLSVPQRVPAAGLPWSMTLFGRDSILTCLQTLGFTPELAPATLRALANARGAHLDDFRDEEPGKIIYAMRYGESAAFEDQPQSPYYGAADSTPLFVVLLDEYERWSGDVELVRELEFEAREALRWIDEYADLMGNGYVWYERRNTRNGLENQCWKDSWDSISYHDGRLPGFPRATCELQGYAYDAKMRGARLARLVWGDPEWADRLEAEAAALKERFNRDFWVADGEYYAIALDAEGGQVDCLSSNMGHLLWSGIVTPERAPMVAAHLMSDRLFSGWGVRTLAEGEGRYNPIGFHTGSVWPFDNSFIAWGLRRYGFAEEAARVADGIIDAAEYFHGRLPSAFGGYPRSTTRYPVQHPMSCSPQSCASAAPLLLLRTMLGLEPHDDHLAVDPALPVGMGRIELLDIPGRWGRVDAFARGRLPVKS